MRADYFDQLTRGWPRIATRRTATMVLAGATFGAVFGIGGRSATGHCKQRLADCTAKSQCCGKRSKCATSHGAGSNTCCGGQGATCTSDLTCCIEFMCENGRCALP